jgi:hypothetical protein
VENTTYVVSIKIVWEQYDSLPVVTVYFHFSSSHCGVAARVLFLGVRSVSQWCVVGVVSVSQWCGAVAVVRGRSELTFYVW